MEILFSDLIVIWRAWALFKLEDRQWVTLIPFMLRIGAVGKYVFLGGCYLLLNLYTLGLTVGNLIWISTPHNYDHYKSPTWIAIFNASRALSIATNAVTTMMIAYKLWYVAMNETCGSSGAHHNGI